jgi:O-antigen ligase
MSGAGVRVGAWGLVAAAFVLAPLGALAPMAIAPLALLAAVAALPGLAAARWHVPWSLRVLGLVVAAMLVWCWLSALWAIDPGLALARAGKLTVVAVVGLTLLAGVFALPQQRLWWLGAGLCAGFALALALMALDVALLGGLRRAIRDDPAYYGMASLNRGATLAALLVWPAAVWLWREAERRGAGWPRPAALALVGGCIGLLAMLESQSSAVALGAGLAGFVLVMLAPGLATRLLALGFGIGTMAAPVLPFTLLVPERVIDWAGGLASPAVHRLYIWRFTAERILERPLLGWGLDSSRVIPGRETLVTQVNPFLAWDPYGKMPLLPLHPHNAPLQLWLELGLPGAALLALLGSGLLYGVARGLRDRLDAAAAVSALVVALVLSGFSYGIWQTWWLGALWLAAAMSAAVVQGRGPAPAQA